jgi:hypothetical protein
MGFAAIVAATVWNGMATMWNGMARPGAKPPAAPADNLWSRFHIVFVHLC